MKRSITINFLEDPTDEQYADVANAVWTMLNLTEIQYSVAFDKHANPADLNGAWSRYSDRSWK